MNNCSLKFSAEFYYLTIDNTHFQVCCPAAIWNPSAILADYCVSLLQDKSLDLEELTFLIFWLKLPDINSLPQN